MRDRGQNKEGGPFTDRGGPCKTGGEGERLRTNRKSETDFTVKEVLREILSRLYRHRWREVVARTGPGSYSQEGGGP